MRIEALGDRWLPERPAGAAADAVGARGAARASRVPGRDDRGARAALPRLASTARASCASPELGPLRLDDDFDPALLRHIWVLKLAEEEAEVVGDLQALGVREVLVTHGSRGATVYTAGTRELVSARGVDADPTGAGDAFMTAYVVARNAGFGPGRRGAARNGGRRGGAVAAMIAIVSTTAGVVRASTSTRKRSSRSTASSSRSTRLSLNLPRLVAAAAAGATVLAVVDTKPPIVVSHDAGTTWRESGRGLPRGPGDRDRRRRSRHRRLRGAQPALRDAGRRRLLERARRRAAGDRGRPAQKLNSPRATITAEPPTSTRSMRSPSPSACGVERRRAVQLGTLRDLDLLAERDAAVAREMDRERAGGRARRRVLADAVTGREHPRLPARPRPHARSS